MIFDPILAHGPWYMEWHHLVEYMPWLGPPLIAWWATRKDRRKK